MPRQSKKAAEDKSKAAAAAAAIPQVAPQPQPMMQQPMMPQGMPHQNFMPQPYQQQPQQMARPQHQVQQFAPQVQMPPPPPQPQQPQQQQMQQLAQPQVQPSPYAGRVVDAERFISVRDSTLGRLSAVLALVRDLANDYIRQSHMLLGEDAPEGQQDLFDNFEHAATQMLQQPPVGATAAAPVVEEKKERKKRTHDPNAPKRPLTPYFLYMQHARGIIANDLGPEAPKRAVQEEGQRRWASMGPEEKNGWNQAYQYNLRLYNARTQSYKSGNLDAKDMSDEQALAYADTNNLPMPAVKDGGAAAPVDANDQDAIAQQLQQVAQAPIPNMPEQVADTKTPKKATGGRKRKSEAADADASKIAVTPNAAASPAKRRRSGKATQADTPAEEPKKSARKKTKSN